MNQEHQENQPVSESLEHAQNSRKIKVGISHNGKKKKRMRGQGPIWDKGSKRERTRVCVYKIQDGEKLKWRVRWYEAGCKKAQTRTHCAKEAAEADAERIYQMMLENRVGIGTIDEDTLFEIREAEKILAGSGFTPSTAARRLMTIIDQVPKGKTINDVVQRGLAVLSNTVKYEKPLSFVMPVYLEYQSRQNGLCKKTCISHKYLLTRLGRILGSRPVSDIDEIMIEAFKAT